MKAVMSREPKSLDFPDYPYRLVISNPWEERVETGDQTRKIPSFPLYNIALVRIKALSSVGHASDSGGGPISGYRLS